MNLIGDDPDQLPFVAFNSLPSTGVPSRVGGWVFFGGVPLAVLVLVLVLELVLPAAPAAPAPTVIANASSTPSEAMPAPSAQRRVVLDPIVCPSSVAD